MAQRGICRATIETCSVTTAQRRKPIDANAVCSCCGQRQRGGALDMRATQRDDEQQENGCAAKRVCGVCSGTVVRSGSVLCMCCGWKDGCGSSERSAVHSSKWDISTLNSTRVVWWLVAGWGGTSSWWGHTRHTAAVGWSPAAAVRSAAVCDRTRNTSDIHIWHICFSITYC